MFCNDLSFSYKCIEIVITKPNTICMGDRVKQNVTTFLKEYTMMQRHPLFPREYFTCVLGWSGGHDKG
jgi:hypothetical protein